MSNYYSTFISGFQEVVKTALFDQLADVEIDLLLDGLVAFQSKRSPQTITNLRFLNNTFLLLHVFQLSETQRDHEPLEFMMNAVLRNPGVIPGIPRWAKNNASNFRIITSRENQTESVNRDLLSKLEKFFSYRLGLRTHRSKPDMEVWFLSRSEGYGFVGLRLTRTPNTEKTLKRGELRPELANLMCLISEPGKEDVVLDPFAGSGAIPLERVKAFPYRKIIASEQDEKAFRVLQQRVSDLKLNITLAKRDALDLSPVASDSITRIITDPPWGIYDKTIAGLEVFYKDMLGEFERVIANGGLICILMGQKDLFEKSIAQFPAMVLLAKVDILVSGKKAAVYKIKVVKKR